MREYLTDADLERAKKNGIPIKRVKQRFYSLGWSKERSITQKYKPITNVWGRYKDVSVVDMRTFYSRTKRGWTPEEAAKTPILGNGQRLKARANITPELMELAEKNGIKRMTLYTRMHSYKWSPEDAATIPVGKRRPNRRRKGWR